MPFPYPYPFGSVPLTKSSLADPSEEMLWAPFPEPTLGNTLARSMPHLCCHPWSKGPPGFVCQPPPPKYLSPSCWGSSALAAQSSSWVWCKCCFFCHQFLRAPRSSPGNNAQRNLVKHFRLDEVVFSQLLQYLLLEFCSALAENGMFHVKKENKWAGTFLLPSSSLLNLALRVPRGKAVSQLPPDY